MNDIEHLAVLAASEGGYMLTGQAEDARMRDAFEATYTGGEIGHFTTYAESADDDDDDEPGIDELLQPYTGDGVPDLFAIERPDSVYVDRLLFASEANAMAYLFRERS